MSIATRVTTMAPAPRSSQTLLDAVLRARRQRALDAAPAEGDAALSATANDNEYSVRRNPDGSIDIAFYKARARHARREAVAAFARRLRAGVLRLWRKPPT
jgi:hypothetical protein